MINETDVLVRTIDGVKVYSNLEVAFVVGHVVAFVGGSTANTETGRIKLVDCGHIKIVWPDGHQSGIEAKAVENPGNDHTSVVADNRQVRAGRYSSGNTVIKDTSSVASAGDIEEETINLGD